MERWYQCFEKPRRRSPRHQGEMFPAPGASSGPQARRFSEASPSKRLGMPEDKVLGALGERPTKAWKNSTDHWLSLPVYVAGPWRPLGALDG